MKVVYLGNGALRRNRQQYLRPNGSLVRGEVYTVASSCQFGFKEGEQLAYFLVEKCRIRMDAACTHEFGRAIPYPAKWFVPLEYWKAEFHDTEGAAKELFQQKTKDSNTT